MKHTLLILGHSRKDSFNHALLKSYEQGLIDSNTPYDTLFISDMDLSETLDYPHNTRKQPTDSILMAQDKIKKADHLVFFFPGWWGTGPAMFKLFIDMVFAPGFAFNYLPVTNHRIRWEKHLKNKTARIVITLDTPPFIYRFLFNEPGFNMMRRSVLEFCGIKPVNRTLIGSVKTSDEKKRKTWLEKLYRLGRDRA